MPIVLGHEAAGIVEQVGPAARGVKAGDHVVLSWNPHCGHCFYCDRDTPILCEEYLGKGPKAVSFDGEVRTTLADGRNAAAIDVSGFVRRILHRVRPAGDSRSEGDAVRPRLPDRLRRHDRGRGGAQSRRHRAWRQRDGDRLRRGRAGGGAGRAAGRRRRDHRRRSRSGETGACREDGRDPWRRCVEGRRGRRRKARNRRPRRRCRDRSRPAARRRFASPPRRCGPAAR